MGDKKSKKESNGKPCREAPAPEEHELRDVRMGKPCREATAPKDHELRDARMDAGYRNTPPNFLKECIADALLRLMKKKSFEKITITEITELASVGRVTYYRNFRSKEEILIYKVDLLLNHWVDQAHHKKYSTEKEIFISLFQYLLTIGEELEIIVKAGMESILLLANYRVFETMEYPSMQEKYNICYHSMGLSGVILSWIKRGMQESPEEMGEILSYTIFRKG